MKYRARELGQPAERTVEIEAKSPRDAAKKFAKQRYELLASINDLTPAELFVFCRGRLFTVNQAGETRKGF